MFDPFPYPFKLKHLVPRLHSTVLRASPPTKIAPPQFFFPPEVPPFGVPGFDAVVLVATSRLGKAGVFFLFSSPMAVFSFRLTKFSLRFFVLLESRLSFPPGEKARPQVPELAADPRSRFRRFPLSTLYPRIGVGAFFVFFTRHARSKDSRP